MNSKDEFSFLLVFSGIFWKNRARRNVQIVFQLVYLQKENFNALESVVLNTTLNDTVEICQNFIFEQSADKLAVNGAPVLVVKNLSQKVEKKFSVN